MVLKRFAKSSSDNDVLGNSRATVNVAVIVLSNSTMD